MSVLKEEIEDYLSKLYKPPSKDLYLLRCKSEKQGIRREIGRASCRERV